MKLFNHLLFIMSLVAFSQTAIAQDVLIQTNDTYGQILTDANGLTLYFFTKDSEPNESSCPDGCATIWPVFYAPNIAVDGSFNEADFGEFLRDDNQMQTTYKGWPLYYYYTDAASGDVNGEDNLNHWYVAKADYSIMLMNNELEGLDGNFYNGNYDLGTQEIQYFTDAYGRTLYTWVNDFSGQNNFTNSDFSNNNIWPVYEETLHSVPSVISSNDFATIDVFGHTQLTYKGWPLYYFGQDTQRGHTQGVSVPSPGIWPVAVENMTAAVVNSISEIDGASEISINPNPFSNVINLDASTLVSDAYTINLYNSLGQKVADLFQGEIAQGDGALVFKINEAFETGIYYLRISNSKGKTSTLSIIKK